jgi:hypothetical protein
MMMSSPTCVASTRMTEPSGEYLIALATRFTSALSRRRLALSTWPAIVGPMV